MPGSHQDSQARYCISNKQSYCSSNHWIWNCYSQTFSTLELGADLIQCFHAVLAGGDSGSDSEMFKLISLENLEDRASPELWPEQSKCYLTCWKWRVKKYKIKPIKFYFDHLSIDSDQLVISFLRERVLLGVLFPNHFLVDDIIVKSF